MNNNFYVELNPTNSNDTFSIQKALDDCFLSGGGKVVLCKGVYHVGGLRVRSATTFYLKKGAILKGVDDVNEYFILNDDKIEPIPENEKEIPHKWTSVWGKPIEEIKKRDVSGFKLASTRSHLAMISIVFAENVCIIGEEGSLIDGANVFDEEGEEYYRGPHGINVFKSKNVTFSGLTLKDTGNYAVNHTYSQGLISDNLTVLAGHDGVHYTACDDMVVKNCKFYTGDDCVAGQDLFNLRVENTYMNTACNAMRLGGKNIHVINSRAIGPAEYLFRGNLSVEDKKNRVPSTKPVGRKMLSFFTYYSDFGFNPRNPAENILIENCEVANSQRFLHFNYSGNECWQLNKPLKEITFKNIKATGIDMPVTAYGDESDKVTLNMENCSVAFTSNDICTMRVANYNALNIKNCNFISGNQKVESYGGDGEFNKTCSTGIDKVEKTDKPFVCDRI